MHAGALHRAFIYDKGGQVRLGELEGFERVRWSRVRDDISEATIFPFTPSTACCDLLSNTQVGRHELVLYRGEHRVWEGPLTLATFRGQKVELDAKDVMWYANRTIMHAAYSNAYPNVAYVTDRAANILRVELARKEALDPPINVVDFIDVRTNSDTARTTRSTKAYQKYVWEELDEMAAKAGLDYTVVGRRIVLWDTHDTIGQTQMMTERDFLDDVIVTVYGAELATYAAVTDGDGHWGAFGGIDAYYGEVELLATAYDENQPAGSVTTPTEAELRSQAQRNLAGRYPVPTIVRVPDGASLNPNRAALAFEELVPGIAIPLRVTNSCRPTQQLQKLDKVVVEQGPDGETIQVTMSPFPGTTPWDDTTTDAAA